MRSSFLPYGRQTIEEDDVQAVTAALLDDFLTTGPLVEKFERAFAVASGANYAVACNSGTAALHLAMLSLEISSNDAVVVPAITFVATANAVRMCGAHVVFADVHPETGLMTPETLREAFDRVPAGAKVKAAVPVHLNGQVCDMRGLAEVADENGIVLVEDACHALGVQNIGANQYSVMACFSTHPVKAIATGEGGVVTAGNLEISDRLRQLRNHGITRDAKRFRNGDLSTEDGTTNPWYYEMQEIGWNYRMPDILCALGISQLKKLHCFQEKRRTLARRYDELFAPLAPTVLPVPHGDRPNGWHIYAILVDFVALGLTRAQMMGHLRNQNIGTQVHYIPVNCQPYYKELSGGVHLPKAQSYYDRCLSIPLFPAMSVSDVEDVVSEIAKLVRR